MEHLPLILLALCAFIAILLGVAVGLLIALLRRKALTPADLPQPASPEALEGTEKRLDARMEAMRHHAEQQDALQRRELAENLNRTSEALRQGVADLSQRSTTQLDAMRTLVAEKMPEQVNRSVGQTVEARFKADFSKVGVLLDEVKARLTRLEQLDGGVKALAGSVTTFSKMLGNVKARGTWAEWQLGNILSDMMAPGQFAANVHPNPRAPKRVVEYAIALPGNDEREQVWLPIDSKFPSEDYERLLQAAQAGDREGEEIASKALVARVRGFAKDVRDAYILPPHTTDFAILFLPTEGLYLEMLRHADAVEEMQRSFRVLLAGPTTLAALINALQMGFQTLAVQKNTVKVMETLRRVKEALDSFNDQNEKLLKNLQTATGAAEENASRIRTLTKKLREVSLDSPELSPEAETPHA